MLAPDAANRASYFEIELGPFGHYFDLAIDRSGKPFKSDAYWSSGLTLASIRNETMHTATIEAKFTAAEILRALKPNASLPLGLFRLEGRNPRKFLAWSPAKTAKPNFHIPEAFGTLHLMPATP
jgi:hypothetical protein